MTTRTLPSPPCPLEAKSYYSGLPSEPLLVARSSTTPWHRPTGPEAYPEIKELRPVGNHAIKDVWDTVHDDKKNDNESLTKKVFALLDSMNVKWTSIDILRIGIAGERFAPVILWMGVMPASLSASDGVVVACKCKDLLEEHGIDDVDVEIRESVVTRMVYDSREDGKKEQESKK